MPQITAYLSKEKHLFNYMGLEVYFSLNDSDPLTLYGRHEDTVSKLVVHLKKGIFSQIETGAVEGFNELDTKELEKLITLVDHNLPNIIKYWIDCYVYHSEIPFENIFKPIEQDTTS